MPMEVLIEFECKDCNSRFIAWSDMYYLMNPTTKEPIRCVKCGSKDLKELETLEVSSELVLIRDESDPSRFIARNV